ncbi:MAG: hypothetical protein KatS3mg118_2143 [Paracoccaceae bacterium]|nr:MAG: hypothetical protein KatS3mg118_2143 [Paracoccaceae bacterium]
MRRIAAGLALAAALAAPASAEGLQDYVTPDKLRQFQMCRAAVFYHLDDTTRGASRIPLAVARAMREQMDLLMQELLLRRLPGSSDEALALIRLAEGFFLGFSRLLQTERARLTDPLARDAIIHECQPFLWAATLTVIDGLMAWRTRAMDAPALADPAEELRRQDEVVRRLAR